MTLITTSAVVVMHAAAWSQTAEPSTDDPPTVALSAAELKIARSPACLGHADCIKWFPQWFSQKKNLVQVKLVDGQVKTFKENTKTDGEGWRTYSVRAYYPQWNSVVVVVGYSEGWDMLVINHRTGTTVGSSNIPHYSNSGALFASVGSCGGYCNDGIEIWSTASDPPQSVFKHQTQDSRSYEFVGWNGEGRLKVLVATSEPDKNGKLPRDKTQPAEVVRGPNGWKLVEPQMKN